MRKTLLIGIITLLSASCSSSLYTWERKGKLQWNENTEKYKFIPYSDWQRISVLPDTVHLYTLSATKPK